MRKNCVNDECDRKVFQQRCLGLCHRCFEIAGVVRHLLEQNILQTKSGDPTTPSGLYLPKGYK